MNEIIDEKNLEKLSGGYHGDRDSRPRCDNCGGQGDYNQNLRYPLIPYGTGHLCTHCIKNIEKALGRKIL